MRMSLICCPFDTSYGEYAISLKSAVERKTGDKMQWIGSNCGCGDQMAVRRQFRARDQCEYFEMRMPSGIQAEPAWRHRARGAARTAVSYFRAKRYADMTKDAELVHFQQIINAYGSKAVFHWLSQPSDATRVVTIHELDYEQRESPDKNAAYNNADALIVHFEALRDQLVGLRVRPDNVHVVPHGTDIPEHSLENRAGIVFYAGHHLDMSNKGLDTVLTAMSIIRQQRPVDCPTLSIHGHYGSAAPEKATRMAADLGIADNIVWRNQISKDEMVQLYQRSRVCVLPYTGSFAGLPAATAAACEVPIVATRKAGLPDHLGESGIWVDENKPDQLASRVLELLGSESAWQEASAKVRKRAEEHLSWDLIAEKTLAVYEQAIVNKATSAAS